MNNKILIKVPVRVNGMDGYLFRIFIEEEGVCLAEIVLPGTLIKKVNLNDVKFIRSS